MKGTRMTNLGVIGAGNMGYAILKGVKHSDLNESIALYIYEKQKEKQLALKNEGYCVLDSVTELLQTCKYILLAVKPQNLAELLETLAPHVREDTVFISICAGISAEYIQKRTIPNAKVILVMPNTPMMLGLGASAIAKGDSVTDEEFAFAKRVISACGIAVEVPQNKMKEIICINGSSPAFIYLFAKGFAEYAESQGIDSKDALQLFAQTLIGSAKMITDSGMSIQALIDQVSSPGGTTLAGLDKLYEGDLVETVKKACEACTKRAYELSAD